jgi:poly(3-hydroxyoctanoate) depolymerase
VTVDGLRLRVSVAGKGTGTPLVLIGGIGAPLELWEPFARALGTETVAVDLPGVGGSATLRRPRSMWGIASILDRVLDQLDYQTVDVLGVSWGGGVAQHLALRHRRRVRLLILASTGFGLWSVPGDPRALLHLLTPTRYLSESRLLQIAASLYGGETRRRPERLRAQAAVRSARRPSAIGYIHQLAAASTWVALPLLPLIRTDTLVLTGDDDPIVHVATAQIMAAALPHGRLHIVRGGGHMFLLDQPREAADIVGSFLRRDDGARTQQLSEGLG